MPIQDELVLGGNRMKKLIYFLISVAMLFVFCACSPNITIETQL